MESEKLNLYLKNASLSLPSHFWYIKDMLADHWTEEHASALEESLLHVCLCRQSGAVRCKWELWDRTELADIYTQQRKTSFLIIRDGMHKGSHKELGFDQSFIAWIIELV